MRTSTSSAAGDIVVGIGLKNTRTGDTISDEKDAIILENLEFPEPVIQVAVEPKTKADQDKMGKALYSLSEEDPTFQVKTDEETGQTLISGMGELHLEVLVDRMLREFSVDATVGKPQVAYRETITRDVEKHRYTHKKQTGGSGQFADVIIALRARPSPARATPSTTRSPAGASPRSTSARSTRASRRRWPPACWPASRWSTSGPRCSTARSTTSTPPRWRSRSPAPWRFKEAARMAKPVLLEPIMAVEVVTPEDYMGDVMGDLSSRRGKVGGMEQRGNAQVVRADVPLSEMFGYATDLRSRTQGRANYTMQFDSYQQMPGNIQEEIVARVRGE